ncbi:cupin domain-containing protein [Oscillospiraceae bacterium 50-60]
MSERMKNIAKNEALRLDGLVSYQEGQVVSRTLAQNPHVSLTLFAFEKGEEISAHSSGGDALATVLEGTGRFTVDGEVHILRQGESLVMPAGIPHAVYGVERFKMLLTVVF